MRKRSRQLVLEFLENVFRKDLECGRLNFFNQAKFQNLFEISIKFIQGFRLGVRARNSGDNAHI